MNARAQAAHSLALRLLAGPWSREAIAAEVDAVMRSVHPRTRRALVLRLVALAEGRYPPAPHWLTAYLVESAFFRPSQNATASIVLDPPRFAPAPAFAELAIPQLATPGELAAWLGEPAEQLDWLADERRGHRRAKVSPLRHYRYAFVAKRGGGARLVEAPKPRLKAMQRRILDEILCKVPVHRQAHGFVSGRCCLTGAQVHAGEAVVVALDLAQFFPSIGLPRVHGLFRSLGYPWAVARRLAGLCTTVTPSGVFQDLPEARRPSREVQALYGVPHLPQGAPTSPALANLLAWRLDLRLHGLARAAGANYTRYADDLAFSGDATFAGGSDRFGRLVEGIVAEEGFALNSGKTRVMPRHARQRVTGVVVNAHCNLGRAEFDALKAILHNCARTGPAAQNRDAVPDFRRHLDGRVAWAEQINPARGGKLRRLFERIDWREGLSRT
jgi:RNA-directed DNA polymerase